MSELNIGGSNMTVELREEDNNTLYAAAQTGNKQWIAILTDTHPKYNYDRDFVAYQKPKTSDRDSGTATVADGAVIERVRYTHSGKNRKDQFYQLVDGEAHEIDEIDVEAAIGGEIIPEIEEETHACGECGNEFGSEHGLAVHTGMVHKDEEDESEGQEQEEQPANADTIEQPVSTGQTGQLVADGGQEIRAYSGDVEFSDDEVRRYSADGTLYAYCEGAEHVVVSRGREPATKWTQRVPAERSAVVAGEQLWAIPDNWEKRITIKGAGERRYAVHRIPETDVDVLVTVPHKNHLVDAWYGVKRVGKLTVTYDDEIAWGALDELVETVRDIDDVDSEVVDALDRLSHRTATFERKFAEGVNMYAKGALLDTSHPETPSIDGWTTDPWGDTMSDDAPLVADILNIEGETLDGVMRELSREHIIPSYPTVRVDVDDREGLPVGYDIRALTEAGCSPAEAVDYQMTTIVGETQTDWAKTRRKDQSTVSGNVKQAERILKH